MAISIGFAFSSRSGFSVRYPLRLCFHQARVNCAAAVQAFDGTESGKGVEEVGGVLNDKKQQEWKKFRSKDLGISTRKIPKPTKVVLNALKRRGFEVYLVGGCVRDLILERIPKDYDIITSAELKEVMRTFSRCEIIGRRFPICHVHVGDTTIEVSSFKTHPPRRQRYPSLEFQKLVGCAKEDHSRWKNCLDRDFTINGLMYDPFARLVHDYTGGVDDITKAKVRTIAPASISLRVDSARILRAIRLAARLGFQLARDTAINIKNLSSSVLGLDRGRLLMEMNYMLAYGSAEPSFRLLWKFGLLDLLLPMQAAYFVRQGFRRRDTGSNMLLSLFSNLDKLLAPDRPCHSSLWISILAFHKAISDQPRDPVVLAAFSLAVHNGGDITEALDIAKMISRNYDSSFDELLESGDLNLKAVSDEVLQLAIAVHGALTDMIDEYLVSRALAEYPKAPRSDVVFIPLALYSRVSKIFECVTLGKEKGFVPKQGGNIDYELLALGNLQEVRHVFARVVFDTVYPMSHD